MEALSGRRKGIPDAAKAVPGNASAQLKAFGLGGQASSAGEKNILEMLISQDICADT